MSLWTNIRNFFIGEGAKVGLGTSLANITDDPRIALPISEVERINIAKQYYMNDFRQVTYMNSYGQSRQRQLQAVNVTKLASRRLASLIFNEQCEIKVNDSKAQKLLDSVFKDNDFYLTFENYLEKFIALGSGLIRPYIANNKIKLAWATADQIFPLESNTNEVNSIAISSRTMQVENHSNVYYTLLEFHQFVQKQGYIITNELYKSTDPNEVGVKVPLDSLEEYADLQPSVTIPVTKPLFAFYKNAGANNKCLESPLGLGLIDNAKTTVDAINRTHDQFIWEIRTGQRRLVVPDSWLKQGSRAINGRNTADTHPPLFDADETVYQGMYGDAQEIGFHDATINIRVDEYSQTMDFFLKEFENQVGLSQGTFTQTPSGIQTATEIVTNNSITYQTRSSYLTMVEKTLKGLVNAILELAQCSQLFDNNSTLWAGDIDQIETTVDFNDGVFIDQNAQFTNDLSAVNAGVLPIVEFIKRNYNLSDEEANKWVTEIQNEKTPPAPDFEQFNPLTNEDHTNDKEADTNNKDGEVNGSAQQDGETSQQNS